MAAKTIKIADKQTLDGTRDITLSNGAKLDIITKILHSGGGISSNPEYGLEAIKAGLNEAKKSVSDGKKKVADAIAAKGIATAADAAFDALASRALGHRPSRRERQIKR